MQMSAQASFRQACHEVGGRICKSTSAVARCLGFPCFRNISFHCPAPPDTGVMLSPPVGCSHRNRALLPPLGLRGFDRRRVLGNERRPTLRWRAGGNRRRCRLLVGHQRLIWGHGQLVRSSRWWVVGGIMEAAGASADTAVAGGAAVLPGLSAPGSAAPQAARWTIQAVPKDFLFALAAAKQHANAKTSYAVCRLKSQP